MNPKVILSVLLLLVFSGVVFSDIQKQTAEAVCNLYNLVRNVLGAAVLLLIFLAAVVYAGGQVLGAETRARANVWATTMFLGAIFAVLLWLIVPWIIGTLMSNQIQDLYDSNGNPITVDGSSGWITQVCSTQT